MKQVFQDARTAAVAVEEVPVPKLLAGCILVRTAASLVSSGTERAASEFAAKSIFQKARSRPDLVREVLGKINRDGITAAFSAVRTRLDHPSALGYSSAGTVVAVGESVTGFGVGDRVACAGAGHAVHAEFACVPRLLVARIPSESVRFDEAAFTTLGAVALHGVRNADAKLGDVVAVIGLGLLGQLTVQILKAAGCTVLGMDISLDRTELASRSGADGVSTSASAFRDMCMQVSSGHGVDAALITAQTLSNDPVNLAAAIARNRARVVAVGAVGTDIPRREFYEKELDFRVSRSYGPGRYDSAYEQKGIDYPIGYVRWSENRNMEAFLKLLADRKLDLQPLITHRFPIAQARSGYELITGASREPSLAVMIEYSEGAGNEDRCIDLPRVKHSTAGNSSVRIGLVGAGSFALGALLPAIRHAAGSELIIAVAANGSRARYAAQKFGFHSCTTDEQEAIQHPDVNTIVIATRHHLHAPQVTAALSAGKHVFCEKPLCLNQSELIEIADAYSRRDRLLMVGFNRRFAPLAMRMKAFLRDVREPLVLHYRVNAGFLPADHWLNDPQQGGGRIVGEVCHFVDLLSFLAGSALVEVEARALANSRQYSNDNLVCSLRFLNGSLGTITYVANGDKSFSKERIEVFGGGAVAVLEDFRRLELVRGGKKHVFRSLWRQDKGHRGEWNAFLAAITNGSESPIPFSEIVATMQGTFALEQSRCLGRPVAVDPLLVDRIGSRDPVTTDGFDQAS